MRMPTPEHQHIPQILNTIRTDLALDDGLDPRFIPGFDEAEKSALIESYAQHKSIRVLKRQVKEILSLRELTLQWIKYASKGPEYVIKNNFENFKLSIALIFISVYLLINMISLLPRR